MHPPEKTILETDLIIDIEPLDIYIYVFVYRIAEMCRPCHSLVYTVALLLIKQDTRRGEK